MTRGRDLEFNIIANDSQFDLDDAARGLEDLGRAAVDAGRDLERLDQNDLDQLGDAARDAARDVDGAMDTIARASRTTAGKLDDSTGKMRRSLDDVSTEANDTSREMAASFDGSADSVFDAFQELGANAGEAFGPVGAAIGVAAAAGIGIIRAEAEKLRELAGDLVDDMLEAGGRLTDEAVTARITATASEDPEAYVKLKRIVEGLTLSWEDFARAKAGDAEAAERSLQAIADLSTELTDNAAAAGSASGEMYAQQTTLNDLAGQISTTAEAYRIAKEAIDATGQATKTAAERTAESARAADGSWGALRDSMGTPINAKVNVSAPSAAQLAAVRAGIVNGIGPVTVNAVARITVQQQSRNIFRRIP